MSEITVRGPKGCAKSLSFDGNSYTANKQGVFTVPSEAAEAEAAEAERKAAEAAAAAAAGGKQS